MAESSRHFVYQFVEKIDETKTILEKIDAAKRSPQENKFIRFIKGRLYNNGSNRSSVLDAVVPGPGPRKINILNKHVELRQVWNKWFVRVTKNIFYL